MGEKLSTLRLVLAFVIGLVAISVFSASCSFERQETVPPGSKTQLSIGWSRLARGDLAGAERAWIAALNEATEGHDDAARGKALFALSFVYERKSLKEEAIESLEESIALTGRADDMHFVSVQRLADLYADQGRLQEAEQALEQLAKEYSGTSDLERTLRGDALVSLATHYLDAGVLDAAEAANRAALAAYGEAEADDRGVAAAYGQSSFILEGRRKYAPAGEACEKRIEVLERLGEEEWRLAADMERCADLFSRGGLEEKARRAQDKADRLKEGDHDGSGREPPR